MTDLGRARSGAEALALDLGGHVQPSTCWYHSVALQVESAEEVEALKDRFAALRSTTRR